jgi:lysozyme family protein
MNVVEGKDYTNDPSDSGGATKWGVTEDLARQDGYTGDMRALSAARAHEVYVNQVWNRINGDDLLSLSPKCCAILFDVAVHMGVGRAGEFLQRSLNVFNNCATRWDDITVDRGIGPITLSTFAEYIRQRDEDVMYKTLDAMATMKRFDIAEKREKDERYVYGWLSGRESIV